MFLNRRVDVDASILAGVRFMSCSTAPLHEEQLRAFEAAYGIPLVQHYGMSEGGMLAGNDPAARRIGTVGRPCIYQDMRIVDEDGRPLPRGQTGEIQISGAQIAYGYLLEDRSITTIRDKPLRTGDLGHFDDEGCLRITGRAKDLIIRGGVNISPLEVEQALISHPGVAEAAAVGVPDKVYGEEVVAYVVRRGDDGPDAASLIAHSAAALPATKRPKAIAFVGAIPRNDRGKIDRNALAALWRRDHAD
jgi:acyl-CoA synthetase (AMP-forming)/AMP-acid ligase II